MPLPPSEVDEHADSTSAPDNANAVSAVTLWNFKSRLLFVHTKTPPSARRVSAARTRPTVDAAKTNHRED